MVYWLKSKLREGEKRSQGKRVRGVRRLVSSERCKFSKVKTPEPCLCKEKAVSNRKACDLAHSSFYKSKGGKGNTFQKHSEGKARELADTGGSNRESGHKPKKVQY